MGKGDKRRPSSISDAEYGCNYNRIFKGVKPETPTATQVECTAIVKRSDVWPLSLGEVDLTKMDHLTACKYLVEGMKVKLIRRADTHEAGWDNAWVWPMEEFIGKVSVILEIDNQRGITLKNFGGKYPAFCLQIIEQENKE